MLTSRSLPSSLPTRDLYEASPSSMRMKKHSNGSSSTNEIETDAVLYAGGSPCSSVSSSAAEEQHLYNLPLTGSIRTGDRVAAGVRRGGGGGDPDIISPTLAGSFDHAGSSVVVRAGSAGDDEQELGCCVLRDDDEALKNQIQGSSMSVLVGGGEDHPDASKVSSIFKSPLECTVLTEEEVSGAVVIGGGGDGGSSAAESPRGRELHTEGSAKQWNYEEQFKQLYELTDEEERKEFLDSLFEFMQRKGTPITRIPIMAKQPLDLYKLFRLVVERGGLVEVIKKKAWRNVAKELNLPASITSAAFTMRSQYVKYLYPYECVVKKLSSPQELQLAIDSNKRDKDRKPSENIDFPVISRVETAAVERVSEPSVSIPTTAYPISTPHGLQLITSPTVAFPGGSMSPYSGGFIVAPGAASAMTPHHLTSSAQLVQVASPSQYPIVVQTQVSKGSGGGGADNTNIGGGNSNIAQVKREREGEGEEGRGGSGRGSQSPSDLHAHLPPPVKRLAMDFGSVLRGSKVAQPQSQHLQQQLQQLPTPHSNRTAGFLLAPSTTQTIVSPSSAVAAVAAAGAGGGGGGGGGGSPQLLQMASHTQVPILMPAAAMTQGSAASFMAATKGGGGGGGGAGGGGGGLSSLSSTPLGNAPNGLLGEEDHRVTSVSEHQQQHQQCQSVTENGRIHLPQSGGFIINTRGGTQLVQTPQLGSVSPQLLHMVAHPHQIPIMVPAGTMSSSHAHASPIGTTTVGDGAFESQSHSHSSSTGTTHHSTTSTNSNRERNEGVSLTKLSNISIQSGSREAADGTSGIEETLLVTIELNNTVYQGVLFAKPVASSHNNCSPKR